MNLGGIFTALLLALPYPVSAALSDVVAKLDVDEAQIHFANLGGIRSWRAAGKDALYIEGRNRQWYFARLLGSCSGLEFATAVGFVTEPSGEFDRFSAILVDHKECRVMSLVKSDPPSKKP